MSSAAKNVRLQQEASLREYVQAMETNNLLRARMIYEATVDCWPEMRGKFIYAALDATI